MKVAILIVICALALPASAHHSWFSRTWRKLTGQSSDQDQCLVSCAPAESEPATCGLMWSSLTEVLTGVADEVPDHLIRRGKRQVLPLAEQRDIKRKVCCFLTQFPSVTERCCSLLRHFCNSLPFDEEVEDTTSTLDKIGGGVRSIADKIGINIDDLGLSWDQKQKLKDELVKDD